MLQNEYIIFVSDKSQQIIIIYTAYKTPTVFSSVNIIRIVCKLNNVKLD